MQAVAGAPPHSAVGESLEMTAAIGEGKGVALSISADCGIHVSCGPNGTLPKLGAGGSVALVA